MAATNGQRLGVWEPLRLIVYGYAIHPLSPSSRRDTRLSPGRLSVVTEDSRDDALIHRDVVSLEVGDEIYAFERYTPRGKEVEGVWYRGYVVCTARRPAVTWYTSSDPSSSFAPKPSIRTEEPQQVFIGIFPASHIHIRDELSQPPDSRLGDLASMHGAATGGNEVVPPWSTPKLSKTPASSIKLDDPGDDSDTATTKRSFRLGPAPDQMNYRSRAGLTVYPASSRASSPSGSHITSTKPLPPRPSLQSGDDTASGLEQPIIDEIASALREWHSLMFQYLARRDYKLFHMVREHIEALHLGRRQLLARTLNNEETINMRRDCVARLVSGNVVQGLDVIVRHPTWGGLVTVDFDTSADTRSWVSAVRMYAMQISLAYLNTQDPSKALASTPHITLPDAPAIVPLPTPAHSAFPEFPRHQRQNRSLGSLGHTPKPPVAKFYHVYLDVRAFVASPCAPGESAELFFSLYSKARNEFITEDFCAVLNHNGVLARDPTTRGRIRTLFTDLSQADVREPVYLVCRIVRSGGMKMGNTLGASSGDMGRSDPHLDASAQTNGRKTSVDSSSSSIRRPFGCATLELTQLQIIAEEQSDTLPNKDHTMAIFVPMNETTFSVLHEEIIAWNPKEFEKSPRADNLAVSIKVFHGDAPTLIRENASLLQDVPLTLRLGFPDVVFPGDSRNEVYIKLWSGEFSSSSHGQQRISVPSFPRAQAGNNVQVSVEVRDSHGRTIGGVISQGSGEPPMSVFHSMVYQRCATPTFGELIKLQLPRDSMPDWHLFFTFRNRQGRDKGIGRGSTDLSSEKPFAFAFQPLFPENRAFVEDGSRSLILHKADKLSQIKPELYLSSTPCLLGGQRLEQLYLNPELLRLAPLMPRDTFVIRTSLCSTKFTHNAVLLTLMNWEQINDKETLSTVLNKFTFIGEVEIVKFLRDIFDALFGIMVCQMNQNGEMDHLVFNALVTVLGIVQDRRFSNFQPVLDIYIEEHFNCLSASSHILRSMNRLLLHPTAPESASPLRAALKVWHYIFKFIARSRELQKSKEVGGGATAEHLESSFKRDLRVHLGEVNAMMSTNSLTSIIGTQTIALQKFTSILPELAKVFPTLELVTMVTTFANSVTAAQGKITIWKLIMYLQIVKGFLFDNAQARSLLVEQLAIWIKPHFGSFDESDPSLSNVPESIRDAARLNWLESIRLCVTIIALMLDKLQQNMFSPAVSSDPRLLSKEQENVDLLLSLLPRLLDSYVEFSSPASKRVMDQTRDSVSRSQVPVTFPESYPFSLVATLPKPPVAGHSMAAKDKDGDMSFNPGLGEAAIVFLVLILSSSKKDITNFFLSSYELEGRERFITLLMNVFKVSISIMDNDAFPKSWLNVNILAHKVLVKLMDCIASPLELYFIPSQDAEDEAFHVHIWMGCFTTLLQILSSDQLVIEEFSPQKRRAVWRLAGDIRGDGAAILLSLWQSLGWSEPVPGAESGPKYGGYQVYLGSLVGHVVNLCLSHHDQLRSNAVQMLFSMILTEYAQSGHINGIEYEIVNRLDSIFMSDSKGDDVSRTFFIGHLRNLFEPAEVDAPLRERVANFLDDVDMFLELLLSVRALPEGEEFADDRVIATLRLMNFIRRIGRDEIYIKYVHQLVNMHLQAQNYIEAALTLKLHSDLHEWDLHSYLPAMDDLGLPQQSQFHRKETLCLLILDYLGKGKAWESAVQICKELARNHEEITFNYTRLADILRHEANLLEHIINDQRYYPDFYRVTFYGHFPSGIRGKHFIYRGFEWEKFNSFCDRMLTKHPGAQLLRGTGDPSLEIKFGEDQYIHCTPVTPEPARNLSVFTNPDVPRSVRAYYEHSSINLFSFARPIIKKTPEGEELWQERIYFTTEELFPTVLRRSEVVDIQIIELSPLESAISAVEEKTKDLAALNARFMGLARTAQVNSTNQLAMALNSAVDTPGDDGIPAYRHIFLDSSYVGLYPDRAPLVEKLRNVIDDHVRVLDSCMTLHQQLCPPEFLPFHDTLEKFYHKNFHEEITRLSGDHRSELTEGDPSHYPASLYSHATNNRQQAYVIPPLPFGRPTNLMAHFADPSPSGLDSPTNGVFVSPEGVPMDAMTPRQGHQQSPSNGQDSQSVLATQTPLKRHLAHLVRHGINGVSSAPGDSSASGGHGPGSDSQSVESGILPPGQQSLGRNASTSSNNVVQRSAASMTTSHFTSSLGSIKGKLKKIGSFRRG